MEHSATIQRTAPVNSATAAQTRATMPWLSGSLLFLASTTLVNAGNYLFNLLMGRWLGPAAFADLNLIITLFLVFTFITTGLQQTAARFAAIYHARRDAQQLLGLRHWLQRNAWVFGIGLALILGLGAPLWRHFFQTESPWIFVIFAIGLPIYFSQGVDRGIIQGQMRFDLLSTSYQAEMWMRLLVGVLLVMLGWSVQGAVGALTLSILATWLVARRVAYSLPALTDAATGILQHSGFTSTERRAVRNFLGPILLAETSLILINHSDILIVKRFFTSVDAGHYAALALIGRIVFFATWSLVMTMFPLVAQKQQRGESHHRLLWVALSAVFLAAAAITGIMWLWPHLIINSLFGPAYLPIAPLLWLYAVATGLFALANVLINYRLALGNATGAQLAFGAGLLQVALLWCFHATLVQVILIQIGLMGLLLALLSVREGKLQWERSIK